MSQPPAPYTRNTGFTLIELIAVIVLVGILGVTALSKFGNLGSEANAAVIKGTTGALWSGINLFRAKTISEGQDLSTTVEYAGVTGSHYQPFAIDALDGGGFQFWGGSPEIFEAAGVNPDDWAYSVHPDSGGILWMISASPRNVLNEATPTQAMVEATDCYFTYERDIVSGIPTIEQFTSGC